MSFSFTILMGLVLFCGTALSETNIKTRAPEKKSDFTYAATTEMKRNFDQYANTIAKVEMQVGYSVTKDWSLGTNLGYDTVVSVYDPNQNRKSWGIRDIEIGSQIKGIGTLFGGKLSSVTELTLPTSDSSQKSSLRATLDSGFSWSQKSGKTSLGITSLVSVSNHEFDTADAAGNVVNSPIGWLNIFSIGNKISRSWKISGTAFLYNFQTYRGVDKAVQGLSTSTSYSFDDSISAKLKYQWKDRLISNNSAFDDDTSVISFQLGFSL